MLAWTILALATRADSITFQQSIGRRSPLDIPPGIPPELTWTHDLVAERKPSADPGPRVAICIAGGIRSFEQPGIQRSIKHHLLDALHAPTDVFVDFHVRPRTEHGTFACRALLHACRRSAFHRGLR